MTRPTAWDLVEAYSNPVPADIGAALSGLGIDVLRSVESGGAAEYLVRCPAHQARLGKPDRRPSCWVNSATGAFLCFSCGYCGPFVQLVADVQAADRVHAARWILRHGTRRPRPSAPSPDRPPNRPQALGEAALALYGPPPPQALAARGLSAAACARYGVLFDPRRQHWILPIRDHPSGQLLGWQEKGKRFFRNRPTGVKKSGSVFGAHTLTGGTAILVESPLDAVRLDSLGFPGAVAAFGAMVSDAQIRIIKRRCTLLILALDNDAAGNAARDTLYARWRPRGLDMRYFNYANAPGKDPGEMAPEQITRAVETACLPFRKRR